MLETMLLAFIFLISSKFLMIPLIKSKTNCQSMFLVPTKLVKFIFGRYKFFCLFFVLVKSKYVIFWPKVRCGEIRSYVLFEFPHQPLR